MKEYIKPRMEVEEFDIEDIITSSQQPEAPAEEVYEKGDNDGF